MKLKDNFRHPSIVYKFMSITKWTLILLGGVFALIIIFSLSLNTLFYKEQINIVADKIFKKFVRDEYAVNTLDELKSFIGDASYGLLSANEYPKINLQIKHKNVAVLYSSLTPGNTFNSGRPYVPMKLAVFNDGGITLLKGKIRSKGDRELHRSTFDTMSFRVNLKGSDRFDGLEEFAIQHPIFRNYIWEYLITSLAAAEDILTLKMVPISFSVNGDYRGIYTVEEAVSKSTIERNGRKYGPIFSLNEEFGTNYPKVSYEVYDDKYWYTTGLSIYKHAKEILELYKSNASAISKNNIEFGNSLSAFDTRLWAKYFALNDLFGSFHGTVPKSVKLYFNPTSGLFEPIVFDSHVGGGDFKNFYLFDFLNTDKFSDADINCEWVCKQSEWYRIFFHKDNIEFLELYKSFLTKYSSAEFIENIQTTYDDNFRDLNNDFYASLYPSDSIFYKGFSFYFFDLNRVYARANEIKEALLDPSSKLNLALTNTKINNYASNSSLTSTEATVTEYNNLELKGIRFTVAEPTVLYLTGNTIISGIDEDHPLVFKGPLMFVQDGGSITLENVEFKNGLSYKVDGRNWSGAVNILNSTARITNVKSFSAKAEDAINFVSSVTTGSGLEIYNAKSDGIDVDFGTFTFGSISCNTIGNDCFDTSGVSAKVQNIFGNSIEDKLISAGENSRVYVDLVEGTNIAIGVVSKDSSSLKVSKLALTKTDLHGAVFTKKKLFSQAYMQIELLVSSDQPYIFFTNSKDDLSLNDQNADIKEYLSEEIESKMYGAVYGTATKR